MLPSQPNEPPVLIVGLGGTTAPDSSSEKALRAALAACERLGARSRILAGEALCLPPYGHGLAARDARASDLVEALRAADGVILSSPGYHGSVSGLLKNALDYAEELAGDAAPYLDGRPVGLITAAAGWQATTTTLSTLRSIVHALRGWPTPLGVTINSQLPVFDADGTIIDVGVARQVDRLAAQVVGFAGAMAGSNASLMGG